ncbi:hypothetical protein JHD46_02005 [Sulfurimonas sp. SAG-AH-194-C20]|nr:hypothetical protein [Sulfurimonas sp. SAG-AH-194-C20]MDF1878409.1 hypothetical protein [Sulfurimonas sp. SAG-AH-194-C20]
MLKKDKFEKIKKKYGSVSSWAIWEKMGEKPKSNISNMEILEIDKNPKLLELLNTNIVMVGLNFARECEFKEPFMNFHDSNPHGQDYKIRYAFEDTQYYGAYMTDIIKNFPMLNSKDVFKHLKQNPDELREQLNEFENELKYINSCDPIILAFGEQAYQILQKGLDKSKYSCLIKLTHYSHHISMEKYRKNILSQIQEGLKNYI